MQKTLFLMLAVILASLLAACGTPSETTLTGEGKEAVLAYSEAKIDNLLAGMNADDYAAFSKDFGQDMLNAMTRSEFEKEPAVSVPVVFRKDDPHEISGLWFNK